MNENEAREAIAGGADIIDVKNPVEGALGANYPWIIRRILEITPKNLEVSCTLGEVPNLPGSISLAALGAASLGVNYIKMGLNGLQSSEEAIFLLEKVGKAAKDCNPKIKLVAVGYADAKKMDALDPMLIPEIAFKAHVDLAMLDTAVKDGKTLFDNLSMKKLQKFVEETRRYGLEVALAGSLRKQDLQVILNLEPDVVGLRGAACTNSDRLKGQISRKLVQELAQALQQVKPLDKVERA